MSPRDAQIGSTTEGLPLAPSLAPSLAQAHVRRHTRSVDRRVVFISVLACGLALLAGLVAQLLGALIGLFTNLFFYGRVSTLLASPAEHRLGAFVIVLPVLGGLSVGLMARYGSKAIRGHGIPEAMEQVLVNESRIPARMTFLKPLSAAISIGTGGPFGAEGPIIATGGALGSLLGQLIDTSASERKTLLAAGAAAGMAATFGSPLSAVILAVELLLFEYRPRSLVPVALASATATAVRVALVGDAPAFAMPDIAQPGMAALALYVVLGLIVGVAAIYVTRAVYAVEDGFERLPLHWMWWPALGGLAVGVVGYFAPRTLGVGYDNIEQVLGGQLPLTAIALLCGLKFVSWVIALGSGTSGGTLAPLFTVGGGLGAVIGAGLAVLAPRAGIDVRVAALVGMAALFAGASRALLASVVFAFEVTRQPLGLVPLLAGCSAAYLVSCLGMRHSIMTEKIARRGVRALGEYTSDFLDQISVGSCATRAVISVRADDSMEQLQAWLSSGAPGSAHQGFPVLDATGQLLGVITRKDLARPHAAQQPVRELLSRPTVVVHEDQTLRDAADAMVREHVGRLMVVSRANPRELLGIVTRSDLIEAHAPRLAAQQRRPRWTDAGANANVRPSRA